MQFFSLFKNVFSVLGELTRALTAAEELLLLFPTNQSVLKAKVKIEKRLAKKDLPSGKTQKSKAKTQVSKGLTFRLGL